MFAVVGEVELSTQELELNDGMATAVFPVLSEMMTMAAAPCSRTIKEREAWLNVIFCGSWKVDAVRKTAGPTDMLVADAGVPAKNRICMVDMLREKMKLEADP